MSDKPLHDKDIPNIELVYEEIEKAEAHARNNGSGYAEGYYDGLYMALNIIRGNHE